MCIRDRQGGAPSISGLPSSPLSQLPPGAAASTGALIGGLPGAAIAAGGAAGGGAAGGTPGAGQNNSNGAAPGANGSGADVKPELTDEEKKTRDDLIDLIRSKNPYQLTRDGMLLLPGFAPMPLAGLTEQLALLRLGIEPSPVSYTHLDVYKRQLTRLALQYNRPLLPG